MSTRSLIIVSAALLLTILTTPPLTAQSRENDPSRIGLGIVLIDTPPTFMPESALQIGQPVRILIPIRIASQLVLEPEVRFLKRTWWEGFWKADGSWLGGGLGILRLIGPDRPGRIYYGARVNLSQLDIRWDIQGGVEIPDRQADCWSISGALCAGGEYHLSPHISIGGEAQLRHTTWRGLEGYYPLSNSERSARSSDTTTGALCFIRIYP